MKRIMLIAVIFITTTLVSCQKEYSCVCAQGSAEIVQADTKSQADAECDAKGLDCNIQ